MNIFRQKAGKPFVLSLMLGLMFLLTACPGDPVPATPPTAVDDSGYSVVSGQPLTVDAPGVLSNDGGGSVSAELVTNVANGDLNLDSDGSFTYTSTAGFTGTDSFTYNAVNDAGSDEATVTITVTAPPVDGDTLTAADDTLTVAPNETVNFSDDLLKANDTIPDGVTATVTVSTTTTNGGVVVDNMDGTYTYTPPAGAGDGDTDSFAYNLSAEGFDDATATVTVTISEGPLPGTGPYDVNFQSQDAETPANYLADYGLPYGSQNGQTYGWVTIDASGAATSEPCNLSTNGATPPQGNGRDRNVAGVDQLLDTLMHMQGNDVLVRENNFAGVAQNCAWQIALPAGSYNVNLSLGDPVLQSAPPAPDAGEPGGAYPVYQVDVEGTLFPVPGYTPPDKFSNPNGVSNGDPSLFVATTDAGQAPIPVVIADEDGAGNGILTIVPTGKNTKIDYVAISTQGDTVQ